jgi:hypothetical protein
MKDWALVNMLVLVLLVHPDNLKFPRFAMNALPAIFVWVASTENEFVRRVKLTNIRYKAVHRRKTENAANIHVRATNISTALATRATHAM